MHFITALLPLAFLATKITAAPTPDFTVYPWNDDTTATGKLGDVMSTRCYIDGNDVGLTNIQNTINNICNDAQTKIFGPTGAPWTSHQILYQYPPSSHYDEGAIFAQIAYHNNPNCDYVKPTGMKPSWDYCQMGFAGVIGNQWGYGDDRCGRLGGAGEDVCFMFWIDPNPIDHNVVHYKHGKVNIAGVPQLPEVLVNSTNVLAKSTEVLADSIDVLGHA
ncbi:hypothetical protein LTR17_006537 [Elasticomyces elasticus]|nr:hypothetical protein LTR17_006537 [Elasticomyces elasticus]